MSSSGLTILNSTTRIQGVMWAEEMDIRDPMLDDDDPSSAAAGVPAAISVVPVTDRTNQFLNGAFTNKMTGTEGCTLRSAYTLPQNELTRAPLLDTMMAS